MPLWSAGLVKGKGRNTLLKWCLFLLHVLWECLYFSLYSHRFFPPIQLWPFCSPNHFNLVFFLSLFLCVYWINRNSLVVWHWHWINTIVPLCVKELLLEQNNVLCHNLMLYTTNKKKSTSPLKPTVWMNSLPSRLSDMLLHAHAKHVYCIKYFLILLMVPCVSSILILARLS